MELTAVRRLAGEIQKFDCLDGFNKHDPKASQDRHFRVNCPWRYDRAVRVE
jgi:hypothetical protein